MCKVSVTITLALLALTGCTTFERTTYQTLAASKATIDQAQADYEIGTALPHNQAAYTTINAAKNAQTVAANQFYAYEQLKTAGTCSTTTGTATPICTPASPTALATAEAQVTEALAQLPAILAQVKALYGGK